MHNPDPSSQNKPLTEQRALDMLRRVCAGREWRLLSYPALGIIEADAARQVLEVARRWQAKDKPDTADDKLLERAAVHVYCHVALYPAVGLDNTTAQDRAFGEIWRYIFPIAMRHLRDPMQADVCANGALATVWEKRGQVRDPGALLTWAGIITTRAAYRLLNHDGAEFLRFDAEDAETNAAIEAHLAARATDSQPLLAANALWRREVGRDAEREAEQTFLEGLIRRCLRSVAQQEVFIALVLRGATVLEVARRLGVSANYVAVLKHHARDRLRQCKALLAGLGRSLAGPAEVGADAR